jgi:hypothetical protein
VLMVLMMLMVRKILTVKINDRIFGELLKLTNIIRRA